MSLTPRSARAIARSAYLWAYPLVVNYGRLYAETSGYPLTSEAARFGRWVQRRAAREAGGGPKSLRETDVSWFAWLDVRDEAWLLTVPSTDMRWLRVGQTIDLWGFLVHADLGSRATRTLFLPSEEAEDPSEDVGQVDDEEQVVRCEPGFVRTEVSIRVSGAADTDEVIQVIEHELRLESKNQHTGQTVARSSWPRYSLAAETTRAFWSTASFALSLVEPHRDDRRVLERIREIGIVAGQPWDETRFPPDVVEAIDEGMEDAITELLRRASHADHSSALAGGLSREATDRDYFARALRAVQHSHLASSDS